MIVGRKPTPSELRDLRGTLRPDRDNARRPRLPRSTPRPPKIVAGNPVALEEWERIVGVLAPVGVITAADRGAIALAAESWARYVAAVEEYQAAGQTYTSEGGLVKKHPAVGNAHEALRDYQSASAELGLSPSSRQRIVAAPGDDDEVPSMLDD